MKRLVVNQIAHPNRALFAPLSNGLLHPTRLHSVHGEASNYYRLCGVVLGRSLMYDSRVDARFR